MGQRGNLHYGTRILRSSYGTGARWYGAGRSVRRASLRKDRGTAADEQKFMMWTTIRPRCGLYRVCILHLTRWTLQRT